MVYPRLTRPSDKRGYLSSSHSRRRPCPSVPGLPRDSPVETTSTRSGSFFRPLCPYRSVLKCWKDVFDEGGSKRDLNETSNVTNLPGVLAPSVYLPERSGRRKSPQKKSQSLWVPIVNFTIYGFLLNVPNFLMKTGSHRLKISTFNFMYDRCLLKPRGSGLYCF